MGLRHGNVTHRFSCDGGPVLRRLGFLYLLPQRSGVDGPSRHCTLGSQQCSIRRLLPRTISSRLVGFAISPTSTRKRKPCPQCTETWPSLASDLTNAAGVTDTFPVHTVESTVLEFAFRSISVNFRSFHQFSYPTRLCCSVNAKLLPQLMAPCAEWRTCA